MLANDEIKEKRELKAKRAEEISSAHYKAGVFDKSIQGILRNEQYAGATQEQQEELKHEVKLGFEMLARYADKESILRVTAALTAELSAAVDACNKIVDEGWV